MKKYSVQQLATMAGVSVRTLHLYDQKSLLIPATRTAAGYRLYGEKELLRLQQILFYKTQGFPLDDIRKLLDKPDFDILKSLEGHKKALTDQQEKLAIMLDTIDKTLHYLKEKNKMTHEELYKGFLGDRGAVYRKAAIEQYGEDAVLTSENALKDMGKAGFEVLKKELDLINLKLLALMYEDPTSDKVQAAIARHYAIIRKFWGTDGAADNQREAYAGLGQLYVQDERFTLVDGQPHPAYAVFLNKAMVYFAETVLG